MQRIMFLFKYQFFTALLLFGVHGVSAQYQIPEKPDFQTSVYDYVGLLNDGQKAALENKQVVAIGETGIDLYWDKTYLKEQEEAYCYQSQT